MAHPLLDIHAVTKAFEALSGLTGLPFSLYDDRQRQVVAPLKEDALLSFLKSDQNGQGLYTQFIETNLRLSVKRNQPFICSSFTGQHHVFIPLHYKDVRLVAVAEAFYASADDFRNFFVNHTGAPGLRDWSAEHWLTNVSVIPLAVMESKLADLRSLLENIIAAGYEKGYMDKKWRCSKTIVSLMANVHTDLPIKDIYQTLVDAVIFLFDADTAAVLSRRNGHFSPEVSAGRIRGCIQGMEIPKGNLFLSQAASTRKPVSVMDSHELRLGGFPDEVISLYLFPIMSGIGSFGFLAVFNSLLDREAFSSVNDLCMLTSYLCGARALREEYESKSDHLDNLSVQVSNLSVHYKDPHRLYDDIVNEAARLVDAEKCSLMMPECDENMLRVFAVKGMNQWLMGDVKVAPGEGIAGKVYEKGEPLLIDRSEGLGRHVLSSKPHYKTHSSVSLPLKVADEVVGVLNLSDKFSGKPFSDKDVVALNRFTSQAALLVKLCDCHERSAQMRELSITDPLTGLFNRRYFTIRLEEEYQRARRYGFPISLAMVDIDNFKLFNDTEGHPAGDYLLKEVSSIMAAAVRTNDILIRYGGEEFVVLMPQTAKTEAYHVSERIRENIKKQIQPTWKSFPRRQMTICGGIATYPDNCRTKEDLLRCADKALYQAKMSGKDCTMIWERAEDTH